MRRTLLPAAMIALGLSASVVTAGPPFDIQAAIVAAGDGDEIVVPPGTYNQAIDFLGKAITVRSQSGPAVTILDGTGLGDTIVAFVTDEEGDSILDGFTIQGGAGRLIQIGEAEFQEQGGGVYCFSSSPTIMNCIVRDNTAQLGGGLLATTSSSPALLNCIFWNNTAVASGGAIYTAFASSITVTNCTIVANEATTGFGGGLFDNASNPVLTNSIFWSNVDSDGMVSSAQIHVSAGSAVVNYSCVLGGWSGAGGTGNTLVDPLFADEAAGDLSLGDFSPCIDSGDGSQVPGSLTADAAGNPRFADDEGVTDQGAGTAPIVDMGALERQVNSETLLANVPVPFPTIQEGINAAASGGTVNVAPGTYPEHVDLRGKAITVQAMTGPGSTVIDGGGSGDVVTCNSGEGPGTVISGFTITGGGPPDGSGIFIDGASPTVQACTFTGNDAGLGGGARCTSLSNPTFESCHFIGNSAGLGGGMYNTIDSSPTVTECTFTGNTAGIGGAIHNSQNSNPHVSGCVFTGNTAVGSGFGGAIYNGASIPVITDCRFIDNHAIDGGGILNATGSNAAIINCMFIGNDVMNSGGAIANGTQSDPLIGNCTFSGNEARFGAAISNATGGVPVIANCTIVGNTADFSGGGIYNGDGVPNVTNSIIWDNAPDQVVDAFAVDSLVNFCDVQGGWPGFNLNVPPQLVSAAGPDGEYGTGDENLRLSVTSPLIDAGNSVLVPAALVTDLDGNPRFVDVPGVPNTGFGTPPVDLGAYEAQSGAPPCPADLSGDGQVGFNDLLTLLAAWGPCPGCQEDLDGSGDVGFSDIIALLAQWGPCP